MFGPLAAIGKFRTQEEAIMRANSTAYGLGAAVFTRDITRAHVVAAKIESGTVWINRYAGRGESIRDGRLTGSAVPTTRTLPYLLGE